MICALLLFAAAHGAALFIAVFLLSALGYVLITYVCRSEKLQRSRAKTVRQESSESQEAQRKVRQRDANRKLILRVIAACEAQSSVRFVDFVKEHGLLIQAASGAREVDTAIYIVEQVITALVLEKVLTGMIDNKQQCYLHPAVVWQESKEVSLGGDVGDPDQQFDANPHIANVISCPKCGTTYLISTQRLRLQCDFCRVSIRITDLLNSMRLLN